MLVRDWEDVLDRSQKFWKGYSRFGEERNTRGEEEWFLKKMEVRPL